ncbi:MAG: methyltransferase domain-containing protein [Rhodospirillaceae bacterium]|nr:methyltransferase domain-containing protein [Rhodospirillaceae bacterium]
MLDRRSLFAAAAAVTSFVSAAFSGRKASAATFTDINLSPEGDVNRRGVQGRFERIPDLDLESKHDFVTGFRKFHQRFAPIARKRMNTILEENGLDPKADLTMAEAVSLVEDDFLAQTSARVWISNQQITWKFLQDYFHEHADVYLAEMDAADKDGPGTLELNPDLEIPDYARHEFHLMPGGYVGDPLNGHVYHHGTNSFFAGVRMHGGNEQDQNHVRAAERLPLPEDGKVKRILDMGCGIGRLTSALKERFPDAEVWGIDVGGPMVRYAHLKARDIGVDVHFAQRKAEDTKFPDGYFDIVTSFIINHEMPPEANKAVIAEAHRVLRPGGYYYPNDFRTGSYKNNIYSQFFRWWDHRWNCEPWTPNFIAFNFEGELEKAGFTMNKDAKSVQPGFGIRHAIKKA